MTNIKSMIVIVLLLISGLPLTTHSKPAFVENIGQVTDQYRNKRTDIIAKYNTGNGLNLFLSKSGIHYQWSKDRELYRMDVVLLDANLSPRISKENPISLREQYQLANMKGTAYSYERITYHDIYPGIDWTFYFNKQGKLEHDFIVKPGAKVSDIRLKYLGADEIRTDKYGNLIATTKYGNITEPKPYTYEKSTGKKISSGYVLSGSTVSFKTGSFTGTMVIDPTIEWATYMGGSEYDEIRDVKVAKDSFVYVVGSTNSTTNIASVGAHLTTFQGGTNSTGSDAFISKFDTDGNCIWSTYYGGSNVDLALSLAVDTSGLLYMAGRTNSQTGIATAGSHQVSKAGTNSGYDVYIVKFDTSGTPLWGTYFGGTGADGTQSVIITADRYNNLYLAGNTQSTNGIATTGAFQATRSGSDDGFIAKFNVSGTQIWGTYFGTTVIDFINGIAVDTSGDIVVAGETMSTTGLSTTGSFLEVGNGGRDGFVAKFDSTGQRNWSTYYGGPGYDKLERISIDSNNAIYVIGITESANNIASTGAHQSIIGGIQDFCLVKLDTMGMLEWSTYLGGNQNEYNPALIFKYGKLYITGETGSPNNISTPDGISANYNNSYSEGLLVTFNSNGQLTWGTYLGGDYTDGGRALDVLENETIVIGGKTSSVNGASTNDAHQKVFGGSEDGWLLKLNMCTLPQNPSSIIGNLVVCENSEQQYFIPAVPGADNYVWLLTNGWVGTSNTDTLDVIAGANSGAIKVVAINSCGASDTISLTVSVNPAPDGTISRNGNVLTVSQTFNSYQWLLNDNPIIGATSPTHIIALNGTYTLQVEGANGCFGLSNEIFVDNFTSISELNNLGVKVYPNPFTNVFTIHLPIDLQIRITDIAGRNIITLDLKQGIHKIDLSNLNNGNYFLNAYDPKRSRQLGSMTIVKISK